MAFVTDAPQTRMFIPIPDNPLHIASSSKIPLFLDSPSPTPLLPISTPPSTLQRKSSLKDITPSCNITKHSVRWTSPISKSRMIPSRESDTINLAAPALDHPAPWSISQSLTHNESSQCEITTLIELGPQFPNSPHRERRGSRLLSFLRPRASSSWSEELQARMNLMHLHKVILPNIALSISKHTPNPTMEPSTSSSSTNHKASKCRVTDLSINRDPVFKPATSINIPQCASPGPRLKRRASGPEPSKRSKKVPRPDENTSATSFRESDAHATVDGFPVLKTLDQLLDPPTDHFSSTVERHSSAGPPDSVVDDDECDEEDESLSDSESLSDDDEVEREVLIRDDVAAAIRTQRQTKVPRRPLNSIKVITWENGLQRFNYLLQNNKMDWRCEDELYQLLKVIDVEKENITIELLKKTHVGKLIKDLSKCDEFEDRSRMLAKGIYRSWLKICRAVDG